ncbi:MAG: hypothetical protein DME61_08160 [Verrucomicrobia bacterium]|nr:MAG: hypothetical protein DME61_08160 [Verrucomicrobiota bacterium]
MFSASGIESLNGIAIDVLARMQSTVIAVSNVFIVITSSTEIGARSSRNLVRPVTGDRLRAWGCMAFSRKSTRRSVFAAWPKSKAPLV